MATSGTASFDLDFAELAEEAWERAGREMRTGYDLRTARRSLNILTIEWQNRGINLWTVDSGTIPLVAGEESYDLPADTVDLLEQTLRQDSIDISLARISVTDYATIPNKAATGRPLQFWVERLRDAPKIHLWPVPDKDEAYTFVYWRMRRIEDAGTGINTADINFRFLPALVAGLAYYIAVKVPELMPRLQMLKMDYEEQFRLASEEDRDKTSMVIVPARFR